MNYNNIKKKMHDRTYIETERGWLQCNCNEFDVWQMKDFIRKEQCMYNSTSLGNL